jgi:hypothetical protein
MTNETNQPDLSEGDLDSLMKSRLPLPVAEKLEVGQQLARSLLQPDHFLHYLTVFREQAEREGGSVYLLTIHQHSPRVSLQRAVQAASTALDNLNHFRWSTLGRQTGSWLGREAVPYAALAAVVPEQDGDGCWHAHGCLYVPPGPGGELTAEGDLVSGLSRFRDSENRIRVLHERCVHIQAIQQQEDLRPIAAYATEGWHSCPAHQRIIELAPSAKAGRHLAHRWRGVAVEFQVLEAEREAHWAWEDQRRNLRCADLRAAFLRRARSISRAGRREPS